jgi:hypothetical protein
MRMREGARRRARVDKKIGWMATGKGAVMHLAHCDSCASTITIAVMVDASICISCHRMVTGCDGDTKTVSRDEVLCLACTVRTFLAPSFGRSAPPARPSRPRAKRTRKLLRP